jgi:hypothetical protein
MHADVLVRSIICVIFFDAHRYHTDWLADFQSPLSLIAFFPSFSIFWMLIKCVRLLWKAQEENWNSEMFQKLFFFLEKKQQLNTLVRFWKKKDSSLLSFATTWWERGYDLWLFYLLKSPQRSIYWVQHREREKERERGICAFEMKFSIYKWSSMSWVLWGCCCHGPHHT